MEQHFKLHELPFFVKLSELVPQMLSFAQECKMSKELGSFTLKVSRITLTTSSKHHTQLINKYYEYQELCLAISNFIDFYLYLEQNRPEEIELMLKSREDVIRHIQNFLTTQKIE